jgi:hypothetical protein
VTTISTVTNARPRSHHRQIPIQIGGHNTMNHGTPSTITRRLVGALALLAATLVSSAQATAAPANQIDPATLTPTRVATAAESKCGPARMSTPGIECRGWDGTDVRSLGDLFVVGFENNQELSEKVVLQTVATFDLAPLKDATTSAKVAKASLTYGEASTTRRSPTGDSEYGILPTCNTRLGVPTAAWSGSLDKVVPTTAAMTAGVTGATTGDSGSWDVTPQVTKWLKDGAGQGTLVLRPEDESLDAKGQQMCLSYVIDLALNVEFAPAQ